MSNRLIPASMQRSTSRLRPGEVGLAGLGEHALAAEGHGAEGEDRDAQAGTAELAVVHGASGVLAMLAGRGVAAAGPLRPERQSERRRSGSCVRARQFVRAESVRVERNASTGARVRSAELPAPGQARRWPAGGDVCVESGTVDQVSRRAGSPSDATGGQGAGLGSFRASCAGKWRLGFVSSFRLGVNGAGFVCADVGFRSCGNDAAMVPGTRRHRSGSGSFGRILARGHRSGGRTHGTMDLA